MAEYSKLAQGSFLCTAAYQVVPLPFVPSYVRVVAQFPGFNSTSASAGTVNSIEWSSSMTNGDGITYVKGSSTSMYAVGAVLASGAGSGITTFSSGLSFSFGAQLQIASITKASAAVVTTASAHGYVSGDVVLFEGISGMNQIAGMPFQVTVTGSTTFTIPWNTNQSNYTALTGSPTGAYVKKVLYPFLYLPQVNFISAITTGSTTTVTTTAPHAFVQGQEIAFRIPPQWGITQLNSLPNSVIPGSPVYGYVTSVTGPTSFVVNINSSAYTAFNSNPAYVAGLSFPQVLAVGDVNTGGWQYSGAALYPSPQYLLGTSSSTYTSTINGPAIQGSFVNNTKMGFVVGPAILTSGVIGSGIYFWEARSPDLLSNLVSSSVS